MNHNTVCKYVIKLIPSFASFHVFYAKDFKSLGFRGGGGGGGGVLLEIYLDKNGWDPVVKTGNILSSTFWGLTTGCMIQSLGFSGRMCGCFD